MLGGIRMGTPALTTRGFGANDFEKVADMLDQGIKIAMQVNEKAGVTSTLKAFNAGELFALLGVVLTKVC